MTITDRFRNEISKNDTSDEAITNLYNSYSDSKCYVYTFVGFLIDS